MDIKTNLENINAKINEACHKAGRNPSEVKLVAVSKFHPAEDVIEAVNCGQILFGENRVQEAKEKFTGIYESYPEVQLHIIGTLQRNKVKDAVKIACCIESVDRVELLEEIEKQCAKIEKKIDVLLELHTGEETKSGFPDFESLKSTAELFVQDKFPHITMKGLMTMAPFTEDKNLIRKSFSTLKESLQKINALYPALNLTELSMGMSNDFELAVEEGSTIVRIGTSIFGPRVY
ncbi:MAG: YggS family pyridoxal phosphate-dependent enzyme [Treponema sp.]